MTDRRFEQGQHVTWKDASGQRYRGRVVQHRPPRVDSSTGAKHDEEVLVIIDGTSHVSLVPPSDLAQEKSAAAGRRPLD